MPAALALCLLTAAGQPVLLRYLWPPGGELLYDSTIRVTGRVEGVGAGGERRHWPIDLTLADRVRLAVRAVDAGGRATVSLQLRRLHLADAGGLSGLRLELQVGDDNRITGSYRDQPLAGTVPTDEEPGEALPIAAGLTRADLLAATRPTELILAPTGELLEQDGPLWPSRLNQLPLLGPALAALRDATLTPVMLPGEAVPRGQEWRQLRLAPIPGGDEAHELDWHYRLGGDERVGAFDAARVDFEAAATLTDQPFTLSLFGDAESRPAVQLALRLRELRHQVGGSLFVDPVAGRLVELRQRSRVQFAAVGRGPNEPLELTADLEVRFGTLLLPAGG